LLDNNWGRYRYRITNVLRDVRAASGEQKTQLSKEVQ